MAVLPDPQHLALLQGDTAERFGQWVSENGPEILSAVSNPLNIIAGGLVLAGMVTAAGATRAAVPSIYHRSLRSLAEGEGAITWGYRDQKFWDHWAKVPVFGTWTEQLMGTQLVAPNGRGKTQALLPLMLQHLEAGRDVCQLEGTGDLGPAVEAHARARGIQVLKVDATDPEHSLAINPIMADTDQEAAQRAAATMSHVATENVHYSHMNGEFARNFTILARDHKRHQGRDPNEATLKDLYDFALKFEDLKKLIKASIETVDGDRVARVDADWISPEVHAWLEQFYLPWAPRDRKQETAGFINYLGMLIYTDAAKRCLCPGSERYGDEVLDLSRELSDEADTATEPGEKGRLILLRFPKKVFQGNASGHAAYWTLKVITDVTERRTEDVAAPLALIVDEFSTILSERTSGALSEFQSWLVNIRKLGVAVTVAYQGWRLLPDAMNAALESNGTNLLISGGLRGKDAEYAQQMLGSELQPDINQHQDLNDRRKRSVNTKYIERPRYSIDQIQQVPVGWWWLLQFHDRKSLPPVIIHVPMARMPAQSADARPQGEDQQEGSPEQPRNTPPPVQTGVPFSARTLPGTRADTSAGARSRKELEAVLTGEKRPESQAGAGEPKDLTNRGGGEPRM